MTLLINNIVMFRFLTTAAQPFWQGPSHVTIISQHTDMSVFGDFLNKRSLVHLFFTSEILSQKYRPRHGRRLRKIEIPEIKASLKNYQSSQREIMTRFD